MPIQCNGCLCPILYPIAFQLKPCNHMVCVKCFHQEVPASYSLQCPCFNCQNWISSSVLLEVTTNNHFPATSSPPINECITTKPVQEVIHFEPDEQMDPFRFWAIKKPHLYSGLIYVAFRNTSDEASFYKANFKTLNSTVYIDDTSKDDLVKIFARIFYPLLFHKNFQQQPNATSSSNNNNTLDDVSNYNIPPASSKLHSRHEFALRCLYALSSGRIMSQEEQNDISTDQNNTNNSQRKLKEKAIHCAKSLAKELLPTKRSGTTHKNKSTKSNPERDDKSSPTQSATHASHIEMDSMVPMLKEKYAVDENDNPENSLSIILGFLLLSAVLIISN